MSKPFLVIQLRPEDSTADSEYAAILAYADLSEEQVERIRAEQTGLAKVELQRYSAIIVGGSPFDVTTPKEDKSDVQKRLEAQFNHLFDQIVEQDFPFLGCCSGNGLLGNYLGTPMSRRYAEPVCARTVEITPAGRLDPLLKGFPEKIRVLLGHKEACDAVPDGTQLLVRGDDCPVQMFRLKNNIYATQFHPEGDPEGFALRIRVYQHHGYFAPEEADSLIEQLSQEQTPFAQDLLQRFVNRYQSD